MEIVIVKNMVCNRCVLLVKNFLNKSVMPFHKVIFGEIHLVNELSSVQMEHLAAWLKHEGFELMDNHLSELIQKIKMLVIKRARNEVYKNDIKVKLSVYLSEKMNYEYTYLSSSFSALEGRTIEKFHIEQRVEKAKELISYGRMTLSEIALELGYGNTAYFSTQFKKTTGSTPTDFKDEGIKRRKALDKS